MMLTPIARERLESDDKDLTLRFFTYIISRQGNVPWVVELNMREVATPSPVLL